MNSPVVNFDEQKFRDLVSTVMDGAANENQLREITELLRASPAARDEYLALVDLHAMLATEFATTPSTQQSSLEGTPAQRPRRLMPIVATAALAACLLIAVTWFGLEPSGAKPDSFATVAQAAAAVWDSGPIDIGSRIGATSMRLKSGLVRIEFDSGVEVTLEGPAELTLVDAANTLLNSGLLTATVPPGAEGFTVGTPSAQVIDLGTSFGIDLSRDGVSSVSVFDGEVEVATPNSIDSEKANKHLLSEGESVRIGTDHRIEAIGFDTKPFEKMWPIASGIVGSTEAIHFVPPWPKRIRFVQSDERIFVRAEGHTVQLTTDLPVNISEPGDCVRLGDLSPATLHANKTVRSYILHFAPEMQLGPRRTKRVIGSITFDRPVLGIIVRHDELLASSHRFGRRSAGESNHRRELKLTGDESGDRITLSKDRKTVSLDLISPGRSSDLVRVIVAGRRGFPHPPRKNENETGLSDSS